MAGPAGPGDGPRRRLWSWAPAVVLAAAIFIASSRESVALPGRSDLVLHLAAYAALGVLVLRGCAGARWRGVTRPAAVAAWLLTALYAVSDEVHQSFVPGRTAAIDDWIADTIGAAIGIGAVWWVARRVRPAARSGAV